MNLQSRIVLIPSILIATAGLIVAPFLFDQEDISGTMFLGLFMVLLLCSIIVLNLFLKIDLFSRLKEIYQLLRKLRGRPEQNELHNGHPDIIEGIHAEIQGWSEDRIAELDRIKKLEQYRKEYIGNVSHELKTPIFNIQGYILTLLDGGLEDGNVNRKYLQKAEKSVERMIHTIRDLESISQLESGELDLDKEVFDIVGLCKDICDNQEIFASDKGIIVTVKNVNPAYVYADKFRIRQVLSNLITNSVKYGKEMGSTLIRVTEAESKVKVEIEDNGIGIESSHLGRLFERFYRVDASRSREMGGTGLGLAIVKHILEAHGEKIQVTSQPGKGSMFYFLLPKAEIPAANSKKDPQGN